MTVDLDLSPKKVLAGKLSRNYTNVITVLCMDGSGWVSALIQPVHLIPRSSCNIAHITPVENLSSDGEVYRMSFVWDLSSLLHWAPRQTGTSSGALWRLKFKAKSSGG